MGQHSSEAALEIVEILPAGQAPLPRRRPAARPRAAPVDRLIGVIGRIAAADLQIDEPGFRRLVDALAPNSLSALAADADCFSSFCVRHRLIGLPAAPETIARYVDDLEARSMKLATVRRRLASVGTLHSLGDHPNPARTALVGNALKAFRRRRGSEQRQAAALRFAVPEAIGDENSPPPLLSVQILLRACTRDALGLRDTALLSVAYDAGLRVSELVAIEVDHIEATSAADGSGLLFVPRSKTDQGGEGAHAWLSAQSMRHIRRWLSESGIKDGPLFRRVHAERRQARAAVPARSIRDLAYNARVDRARMAARPAEPAQARYVIGEEGLTRGGVRAILHRLARSAAEQNLIALAGTDLDAAVAGLSTHSFRVGVTQDLFAAGEDVGPIAQALRWKSTTTALRYARKLSAHSNAAARTLSKLRGNE